MSIAPYEAEARHDIRWLLLAMALLLLIAIFWTIGTAWELAEWSVGPVSLPGSNETYNLASSNFPITYATGMQGWPRIAYTYDSQDDSQDKKFLVVWQSRTVPTADWNICGQMLTYTGTVLGGQSFCLSDIPADQMYPDVVYNSKHNEFVVVWQDNNTPNGSWDINGQLITANGVPTGTVLPVVTRHDYQCCPTQQQYPAIAYNKDDDEYLVVWQDDYCATIPYTTTADIYGMRLDSDGYRRGDFITISVTSHCAYATYHLQQLPAVAYASNAYAHQYLVVWEDDKYRQSRWDIYGQRIDSNGRLIGGNYPMIAIDGNQRSPDLAYDSRAQLDQIYLLTWQDDLGGDWDIYAERVRIDWEDSDCHPQSSFSINRRLYGNQQLPAVAYNPQADEYLIVWQDDSNGTEDIYGQRVAVNDALIGDECPIAVNSGNQTNPAVGCNDKSDKHLAIWQDSHAGEGNDDIYGQWVAPTPTPTPTPTWTPTPMWTPTPTWTSTPTTPTPTRIWGLYFPVIMKSYCMPIDEIQNSGFEMGDFTGLVHGGEYPQAVVSWLFNGERPYQGHFCASLGSLGTPVPCISQTAASAWMYQDFFVPNVPCTVTLSFTYRIFTNDIIDWAYFYAELRTPDDVLLEHILDDGYKSSKTICRNDLGWKTYHYNLNRFKGQTVRLYLKSSNRYDGGFGIWTYVDNITLEAGP